MSLSDAAKARTEAAFKRKEEQARDGANAWAYAGANPKRSSGSIAAPAQKNHLQLGAFFATVRRDSTAHLAERERAEAPFSRS